MLNKIKKIGFFLKKILRPVRTLILLLLFLSILFISFFDTSEKIFNLKLYYISIQQDNTNFINYLDHEMQNIKGYEEIDPDIFLNQNKNFDLVSFKQIENYKFLKKNDSYIVKDKTTNTIQYMQNFKYSKNYDKYEDIIKNSNFDNNIIMKVNKSAYISKTKNFTYLSQTFYNGDNKTISFYNNSYENNNLIKTEKTDFYYIYLFSFFLFFLLLIDLMSYNKRFNKFLRSQARKSNSNHLKNIHVERKEIKQEEKKEILIKINK